MGRQLSRRDFLASGLVTIGAAMAGPALWRAAIAAPAKTGIGPYGPLLPPDANGVRLPEGFTSRVIARAGQVVVPALYLWHGFPDGGACFTTDDGGWVYTSNSEQPTGLGGAGAIRFNANGEIADAYSILSGTGSNCAGGPTPWGTWMSCEEHETGRIWECNVLGGAPAIARPAMGVFKHESAAVDPVHKRVYETEDVPDGRLYRFTPSSYPDLSDGVLEVAQVRDIKAVEEGGRSKVVWHRVPDPSGASARTKDQVAASTVFRGGEGTWFDNGIVYFTTKGDNRVWSYDTRFDELELLYDDNLTPNPPLSGVDNVLVSKSSGDVFVAEDGGDMQIVMITPDRVVAPLLQLTGADHSGSEIAGPAMSPAQDRIYFSSQRGAGLGITYEVKGPFRKGRPKTEVLGVSGELAPRASAGPLAGSTNPQQLPDTGNEVVPMVGLGVAAVAVGAAAIALRHRA